MTLRILYRCSSQAESQCAEHPGRPPSRRCAIGLAGVQDAASGLCGGCLDEFRDGRGLVPLGPVRGVRDEVDRGVAEQVCEIGCELWAEVGVAGAEDERDRKGELGELPLADVRVLLVQRRE